jgi:hypothetical protein
MQLREVRAEILTLERVDVSGLGPETYESEHAIDPFTGDAGRRSRRA